MGVEIERKAFDILKALSWLLMVVAGYVYVTEAGFWQIVAFGALMLIFLIFLLDDLIQEDRRAEAEEAEEEEEKEDAQKDDIQEQRGVA